MLDALQTNIPSLLDQIPSPIVDEIIQIANLVKYGDGQMVHSRGDDKPGLSLIKSGAVNVGMYGMDGSFVMTTILGPGQFFGEFTLFAGLPRTHDISANGETEIYQIPGPGFIKLCDCEPVLTRALLAISLVRLHTSLEMLDAIRRLPLLERTAKILGILMQTSGDPHILHFRQSDLAYTLGVSRVSLGKALAQLAGLKLIELGYRKIILPDPQKLPSWIARHCTPAPLYE
jgi:CRP-like cAMP-binding protein